MTRRGYPVTRVRGEVTPSKLVTEVVNRHLNAPAEPRMFTTAQAIIDRRDYHDNEAEYDEKIRHAGAVPGALGKQAFRLLAPHITGYEDGSGRLGFKSFNGGTLDKVSDRLREIPTLENASRNFPDRLYFELARGALARPGKQRRDQLAMLAADLDVELKKQRAKYDMVAGQLQIVRFDTEYPMEDMRYLPAID